MCRRRPCNRGLLPSGVYLIQQITLFWSPLPVFHQNNLQTRRMRGQQNSARYGCMLDWQEVEAREMTFLGLKKS